MTSFRRRLGRRIRGGPAPAGGPRASSPGPARGRAPGGATGPDASGGDGTPSGEGNGETGADDVAAAPAPGAADDAASAPAPRASTTDAAEPAREHSAPDTDTPDDTEADSPRGVASEVVRAVGRGAGETRRRVKPVLEPAAAAGGKAARGSADLAKGSARAGGRGIVAAGASSARSVRGGLSALAVTFNPRRAALALALVAAVGLGISQFVDATAVRVITVDQSPESAGSLHAYLLAPAALAALAAVVACAMARDRRAALVLTAIGVLGVAVSLLIDLPRGTDSSRVEVLFSDAEARLLGGFYAQLAAAVALAVAGLMLLRPAQRERRVAS